MTTAVLLERAHDGVVSDDDPAQKPTRRRFSATFEMALQSEPLYLPAVEADAALELGVVHRGASAPSKKPSRDSSRARHWEKASVSALTAGAPPLDELDELRVALLLQARLGGPVGMAEAPTCGIT